MTVSGILINCAATAFFLGQVSARACSIHTHLDGSEDVLGLLGSDAPQIAMGDGRLHKRWSRAPCNSDQWTRFLAAGCTLTTLISVDDAAAGAMFSPPQAEAASKWKNFPGDLNTWGYDHFNDGACDMDDMFGMSAALNGIGISAESDSWQTWKIEHPNKYGVTSPDEFTYQVDAKTYRGTGAYYAFPINVHDGAIMLSQMYSPANEGRYRQPPVTKPEELPQLRQASDIAFAAWTLAAGARTNQLKYIIPYSIRNVETGAVVQSALNNVKQGLKPWPGVTFSMDSDEAKALLGSPMGRVVAYFLAQHKPQLGIKTITKVTVFAHSNPDLQFDPVLIFHLG